MPVRAVIFDLDGVLIDSLQVARDAFAVAYGEVVGPGEPPVDEYVRHPGRRLADVLRIMRLPAAMEAPFVRESYRLADRVAPVPGIVDLLRTLRSRGLVLAVATGKDGARARSLLDQLAIRSVFAHVIGSDEVPVPKPAPDIVRRALDLLQVPAAAAVLVGDAVPDLVSARRAGVATVAALWGESDETTLRAARPDHVAGTPAALLDILSELAAG